jgi:hypothetical protein
MVKIPREIVRRAAVRLYAEMGGPEEFDSLAPSFQADYLVAARMVLEEVADDLVEVVDKPLEKVSYPECGNHVAVQHRDGKPPWCDSCGWNRGQAAVPPRQWKAWV